jgi:iron(III) transport system ATP-binding protein
MLMDEPFSGLDNRLRDGIRDETLDMLKAEDTAVLLVTHEPEEAMRMADEIALMRDGRIVQQGAPYNVYNAPWTARRWRSSAISTSAGTGSRRADAHPVRPVPRAGVPDGTEVEIVIRPQHVRSTSTAGPRAEPDAARRHAGARRGAARALHGVRKPRGVPHGP